MKRLSCVLLALALVVGTAYAAGVVFDKKDYRGMRERGTAIADAQNQYPSKELSTQEQLILSRILSQYISGEDACVQWVGELSWEFVTDTVTDTKTQQVLWLGYTAGGDLGGYASAEYSKEEHTFSQVTIHQLLSESEVS